MRVLDAQIVIVTKDEIKDIESRLKKTKEGEGPEGFSLNTAGHYINLHDEAIIFDWNDTTGTFVNVDGKLGVEMELGYFDTELLSYAHSQAEITEEDFIRIITNPFYIYDPSEEETAIIYIGSDNMETHEEFPYDVVLFKIAYEDANGEVKYVTLIEKEEDEKMEEKDITLNNENLKEVCEDLQRFVGLAVSKHSDNHYKTPDYIKEISETNTKDGERRIDIFYTDGGFSSIYLGAQVIIKSKDIFVSQMSPYEGEEGTDCGFLMEVINTKDIRGVLTRLENAKIFEPGAAHERVDRILAEFVWALGYKEIASAYNSVYKIYPRPPILKQYIDHSIPLDTGIVWDSTRMQQNFDQRFLPANKISFSVFKSLLDPKYQLKEEEKNIKLKVGAWKWLQKEARRQIKSVRGLISKATIEHWYSIVDGVVPFGLKVVDEQGNEIETKALPFENDEGDDIRSKFESLNTEMDLIKTMLDVCSNDNNKDAFTKEQMEMLENWKFNL